MAKKVRSWGGGEAATRWDRPCETSTVTHPPSSSISLKNWAVCILSFTQQSPAFSQFIPPHPTPPHPTPHMEHGSFFCWKPVWSADARTAIGEEGGGREEGNGRSNLWRIRLSFEGEKREDKDQWSVTRQLDVPKKKKCLRKRMASYRRTCLWHAHVKM